MFCHIKNEVTKIIARDLVPGDALAYTDVFVAKKFNEIRGLVISVVDQDAWRVVTLLENNGNIIKIYPTMSTEFYVL